MRGFLCVLFNIVFLGLEYFGIRRYVVNIYWRNMWREEKEKGGEDEIKEIDKGVIFWDKREGGKVGEYVDNIGGGVCEWWLLFFLWGRRLGYLLKMSGWV